MLPSQPRFQKLLSELFTEHTGSAHKFTYLTR